MKNLDARNLNRGLSFDAEMVCFCGKEYRVRTRVEKFIDELTGKMKSLKTPAVILEGAYCRACYSDHRLFCPRSIFTWWREIWLENVSELQELRRGNDHDRPTSGYENARIGVVLRSQLPRKLRSLPNVIGRTNG